MDGIYALLRAAAAGKRPVVATDDVLPRLLCPHRLGRNRESRLRAFCYQCGGASGSGLRPVPGGLGCWCCSAVDRLSHVELRVGAWHTEPRSSRQGCVEEVELDADAQSGDEPQNGL